MLRVMVNILISSAHMVVVTNIFLIVMSRAMLNYYFTLVKFSMNLTVSKIA